VEKEGKKKKKKYRLFFKNVERLLGNGKELDVLGSPNSGWSQGY